MHLVVSSEDTLHFYRNLCTHVLIADQQLLLLIDVPIQDHTQQLGIYEVFNLVIPHRNLSACYNIYIKYLGITYDKTKAVEILEQQLSTCQQANRQFCSINTLLETLANTPSCIAAIYAKNKAGIQKGCSLQVRNTNGATISTPIAPNLWILTSTPTVVSTGIMNNLSWRSTKIHQNTHTHPHCLPTTSMQHYTSTFSPTIPLWNSSTNYQHISQHSES